MSCGDPHDIDCAQVLALVCAYLDGELEPADREIVRHHLEDESCTGCLREFGLDRVVKQLVGRCCQNATAPSELEKRLREHVRTVTYQRSSYESITSTDQGPSRAT